MELPFTLQELMTFLVCAVGIIAGAIMLPILWNIKKVVGTFKLLVEHNHDNLKKSFKTIPAIIDDVEQIGGNLRDTTDKLRVSLPQIIQEVDHIADKAKGSLIMAGDVMEKMGSGINETAAAYKKDSTGYFHLFEEFMQLLYRSLTSDK
jgi:hypothetical protein